MRRITSRMSDRSHSRVLAVIERVSMPGKRTARARSVVAALAVVVLVCAGGAFAASSGPEWVESSPPAVPTYGPTSATSLNAVRCGAPTACLAVGSAGGGDEALAIGERWNGTHWTALSPVRPLGVVLYGLSCAGPRFCMAVGGSQANGINDCPVAELWNGRTWSLETAGLGCGSSSDGLSDVSCTSSRFCLAIGHRVERWNGSSWSAVRSPASVRFGGVSCRARNGCAVGGVSRTGKSYALAWWNGRSWATRIVADAGGYDPESEGPEITGISCTWVKFCIAVGGDGVRAVAFQWNGRRWISRSNGALSTAMDYPGPVSCAATNACTTVSSHFTGPLTSYFFNGSRWSLSGALPGDGPNVQGISCVSARACMAVGDEYAANSF